MDNKIKTELIDDSEITTETVYYKPASSWKDIIILVFMPLIMIATLVVALGYSKIYVEKTTNRIHKDIKLIQSKTITSHNVTNIYLKILKFFIHKQRVTSICHFPPDTHYPLSKFS